MFRRSLKLYTVLAIISLAMTQSRGGVLAGVVLLAIIVLRRNTLAQKIMWGLAGMALMVVIWLSLPESSRARIQSIWRPGAAGESAHISAQGRIEGFWIGIEMFRRFPLTGVGIGNFSDYRSKHLDGIPLASHNLIGELVGETGLLGAAAFLFFLATMWKNVRRLQRTSDQGTAAMVFSEFATAAHLSLILMLFLGLFTHNLMRFNWLWLAAFCAIGVRLSRYPIAGPWLGLQAMGIHGRPEVYPTGIPRRPGYDPPPMYPAGPVRPVHP